MDSETVLEVVRILVGPVEPIGDSGVDAMRLKSLKDLAEVVESLASDIIMVARNNKERHEASMKEAGQFANDFMRDLQCL